MHVSDTFKLLRNPSLRLQDSASKVEEASLPRCESQEDLPPPTMTPPMAHSRARGGAAPGADIPVPDSPMQGPFTPGSAHIPQAFFADGGHQLSPRHSSSPPPADVSVLQMTVASASDSSGRRESGVLLVIPNGAFAFAFTQN